MQVKVGNASSYDRIFKAAKRLFALRGYENTSTIMIAREAGTSESQLVKHFGTKDGLLEAIFQHGWESMADLFAIVEECESPADKLRLIMEQTIAGLERDPELKDLMLLEARRIRRQGNTVLVTSSFMEFIRRVEEILKEMRACGQLRPDLEPAAVCAALIGMCEGMLRDELVARRDGDGAAYNMEHMRTVINLVLQSFASGHQKARAC